MVNAIKTVLVLCTGNSCRSHRAEVLLNADLAGLVRAVSGDIRARPMSAACQESGLS